MAPLRAPHPHPRAWSERLASAATGPSYLLYSKEGFFFWFFVPSVTKTKSAPVPRSMSRHGVLQCRTENPAPVPQLQARPAVEAPSGHSPGRVGAPHRHSRRAACAPQACCAGLFPADQKRAAGRSTEPLAALHLRPRHAGRVRGGHLPKR